MNKVLLIKYIFAVAFLPMKLMQVYGRKVYHFLIGSLRKELSF